VVSSCLIYRPSFIRAEQWEGFPLRSYRQAVETMGVVIVLPRRCSLTIARVSGRQETIMPQLPISHQESPASYFPIQWRKLEEQHVLPSAGRTRAQSMFC
jgi:hypothetical protein